MESRENVCNIRGHCKGTTGTNSPLIPEPACRSLRIFYAKIEEFRGAGRLGSPIKGIIPRFRENRSRTVQGGRETIHLPRSIDGKDAWRLESGSHTASRCGPMGCARRLSRPGPKRERRGCRQIPHERRHFTRGPGSLARFEHACPRRQAHDG